LSSSTPRVIAPRRSAGRTAPFIQIEPRPAEFFLERNLTLPPTRGGARIGAGRPRKTLAERAPDIRRPYPPLGDHLRGGRFKPHALRLLTHIEMVVLEVAHDIRVNRVLTGVRIDDLAERIDGLAARMDRYEARP
jgi:hypothetical protein